MLLYILPAVHCPQAPDVGFSVQTLGGSTGYMTQVAYTCLTGYWFPDHTTGYNITCDETGQWSSEPSDCRRKLKLIHLEMLRIGLEIAEQADSCKKREVCYFIFIHIYLTSVPILQM